MPRASREAELELCAKVAETCTVLNLRKAARAVTNLLDEALRPTRLRSSQFGLLVALALEEEATVSRLARLLDLDRTTMTRNLGPLERDGLVSSGTGDDARNRVLHLTERGRAALARALPLWERVQARVVQGLGQTRWKALLQSLETTASVARPAEPPRPGSRTRTLLRP
jgi:DNA-binding MarR family transcriptional regulator